MTGAAVFAAWVLARGLTMGELFGLCGILTLPVVIVAAWILRKAMLKMAIRFVLTVLYRVEVHGLEHARAASTHSVIAANHASFLDGLLLGAFLPGAPVFAIDTFIAKKWWVRPFLSLVDAMPIDPTNPLSLRSMIRAVEGGASCIIFPEGRITTTGSLMKVYEGPAVITERAKALLVPVRIEGVEQTPFSRFNAVRRRWFPKIRITVCRRAGCRFPTAWSDGSAGPPFAARSTMSWCSSSSTRRISTRRCSTRCSRRATCMARDTWCSTTSISSP